MDNEFQYEPIMSSFLLKEVNSISCLLHFSRLNIKNVIHMILLISITVIQTEQSLLKPILFGRDCFMKTPSYLKNKNQNCYSLLCTEQLFSRNSCVVPGINTDTKNLAEMDINLHPWKARKLLNWQFTQSNLAYKVN